MTLQPMHHSRALTGIAYDGAHRVLIVQFVSGGLYEYYDVDRSLYECLVESPHPWTEFGKQVLAHDFKHLN